MKPRTPIRRVSLKRAIANQNYYKLREAFLKAHPWCQVWLAERGIKEGEVAQDGLCRWVDEAGLYYGCAPISTEIHHKKKPKATYLNDVSTWMAVCRESHEWIENHKSQAREHGWLENV